MLYNINIQIYKGTYSYNKGSNIHIYYIIYNIIFIFNIHMVTYVYELYV